MVGEGSDMTADHLNALRAGDAGSDPQLERVTQSADRFHQILFKQLREVSQTHRSGAIETSEQQSVQLAVKEWEADVRAMRQVHDYLAEAYRSLEVLQK